MTYNKMLYTARIEMTRVIIFLWIVFTGLSCNTNDAGTKECINYFRKEVKKSGFPGLHLQLMLRNYMLQNESDLGDGRVSLDEIKHFNLSSVSHYQWVHVAGNGRDYADWGVEAINKWPIYEEILGTPYFPHVSIGWDNNPRFKEKKDIIRNCTPQAFKSFIIKAKDYLNSHPNQPQIIIINSWNEWVEGSYLEPDVRNGYAYLEALKNALSD